MVNANDSRILELKKQIETKKEKIGKIGRFTPTTSCMINIDGHTNSPTININVLDKGQLILLLVKLNALLISAKELELESSVAISGFLLTDWIIDVNAKLDILSKKDEERKLKVMEDKLTQLLSEEKQVELELDGIESLLKD